MKTISDFQYEIEQTRSRVADESIALSDALNFKKRLRISVQQHPLSWLGSIFFVGTTIPWIFKKQPRHQELTFPTDVSRDQKKKSSAFSKIFLALTSLLQDKKMRSGLFSMACFAWPLVQEALSDYTARKKNKKISKELF